MEIIAFALGIFCWLGRPSNRSEEVKKYVPTAATISKWLFITIVSSIAIGGLFGIGFVGAFQQVRDGLALWGAIEIGIYIYLQGVKRESL